ncbi:MAG: 3-phosphoshikimate 1-carboxyvinyltransferase [Fimbriimonadaceae bacterium]|nr:3-phosphoshikimate 1-carboxyvinyltransferase [Chitinophagales bacterium]
MNILLKAPQQTINGTITLEGSKSISNRLLILRAMSENNFEIKNLSPGDDTDAMLRILTSDETLQDVGAAGTTMRFLTSYFAIQKGEKILTGSERMKNRPIGILVDALKKLGADISYLEKDGYPPLRINGKKLPGGKIDIRSDVSSQFISSLLMIAPKSEKGLQLELIGKIASLPYLMMTLKLMESLGAKYEMTGNTIHVFPGKYNGTDMQVESDWSAASYYYSICALNKNSEIKIKGLFKKSLQGDSVLLEIYNQLGVNSFFEDDILVLKQNNSVTDLFQFDFSDCPDLAQTVVVTCAGLGVPGKFSGLESLKIKETDRTQALAVELKKFGVEFIHDTNTTSDTWLLKGKTISNSEIQIKTYEDHRMAMCFAPLSLLYENIIIEEAGVVKKSYPSFWEDLSSLGFSSSISIG